MKDPLPFLADYFLYPCIEKIEREKNEHNCTGSDDPSIKTIGKKVPPLSDRRGDQGIPG
jgi:hypothetical protein